MSLVRFRDEGGLELFDLPSAPRPSADLPVPVRFLPEFDNLLLSHADRSRVMSSAFRKRFFGVKNGVFPGSFLVDGFLRGVWRFASRRSDAVLSVTPWDRLSRADRVAVEAEGSRLVEFLAPGASSRDVVVGSVE